MCVPSGMAASDEWVLYGDDLDLTLGQRNALAYAAARQMGRWAPNTTLCELFLVQVRNYLVIKS